jgi:hypothetical protein
MRAAVALALALACLGALAAGAGAATVAAPSIKALGVVAPTHLPPRQSEVQRVTVEAEGGTFTLSKPGSSSDATPAFVEAHLALTEGSAVATIESITGTAPVEVGDRVTVPVGYEETTILACSSDCETVGSTIELSQPAGATETGALRQIYTKELRGVTGTFAKGEEIAETRIQGENYEYFPRGTVITGVGPGTLTVSNPPFGYDETEGVIELTSAVVTPPIAFNASAATVQGALSAVLGAGTVTVTGGPGGEAANPYLVEFGGALADQDVPQMKAGMTGLTGAHPFVHILTTIPGGNGTGEVVVVPSNVGAAASSGTITVTIGPLPEHIVASARPVGSKWLCSGAAGDSTVSCTSQQVLRPIHSIPNGISVPIEIQAGAAPQSSVKVEISGGGSLIPSSYQVPVEVSTTPAPFGVEAAWAGSYEADGSPSTQAGGHPFQSSAYIMLNTRRIATGGIEPITPVGESKEVIVSLPPGFTGNPLVGKRCPQSLVLAPADGTSKLCNEEMSVGNLDPYIGQLKESLVFESRLYNDIPPKGVAAEFTTRLVFPLQSVIANVNSEEDFGIRLTGPNNPNLDKIFGVFTAFEGVPKFGNGEALLTNPTNCAESAQTAPVVRAKANSYQERSTFSELVLPQPALVGCDKLHFEPFNPNTGEGQVSFSFVPSDEGGNLVSTGSTPVGATAHLHINQPGLTDPNGLATPELKRTVIKLPEGMSLNPSSANGLEGCSETQIGRIHPQPPATEFPMPTPIRFNEKQPECPSGSKLATAEIKTPLLDNPLVGEVFLANQYENPYGSLLGVYLVVNDPLTGVLIKLPGEVQTDPQTGRLTTVFDDNPQLPFDDLILHFRGGGARSEFATSEVCGNFPTEAEWTPWSAPESGPPAHTVDSFNVSSNCASSPSTRPFAPTFEAGTTANNAGGYNPLVIKVARKDGEQEITSLDFTLPKGLIGKLAGIPYCSDQAIGEAEHKTGRQEQANASCPAASQLGTVDTAAGVGSDPFHAGGKLYLAGPYKGAPVSSVAIVPAVAGPLDLGNVVVRAPLYIDHETAELTAKTDPLPTILKGIPLKVRAVNIDVDRPGFILNPTNCKAMTATASFGGGSGATAKASNPFQVAGCKNLKFAPTLKIQLKGKTKRAGNPALTATLTQAPGQANIGFVSVALPHSEFLEQGHIRTNCTRVQFAAEQCPKGSIYGHAEAISPLLDHPLTGPVYLRSSSHRLPDLAVALKGPPSQPIEIDLDGRIDSFKGGIRTTFETVPDAPVSKFVLRLPAGKKSLIVNSTNICKGKHKATVEMTGQNGLNHDFTSLVEPKCPKKKAPKKGAKQKGHKKK